MIHTHRKTRSTQHGFSLPEILIGMTIGLLGMIIIMQVSSVFENQRRSTTSGDDAQNSGAIALHVLQRDLGQAGYGFSSLNRQDKLNPRPYLVNSEFVTPYLTINPLRPVILNPASLAAIQDAGTDSILITYSNSNVNSEGTLIMKTNASGYDVLGGTAQRNIQGTGGAGFIDGDWVTVDDGVAIAASSVTAQKHYLYVASGVGVNTVPVNTPTATTQVYVAPPAVPQDTPVGPHPILFNFGSPPAILAYAVIGGNLSVCNYFQYDCAASNTAPEWSQLSGGIINMRARCESSSTVRVALVSRSVVVDSSVVTNDTPVWHPNAAVSNVVASPSATWGADWNKYRYKTFESVTPIRNAIWGGVPGC